MTSFSKKINTTKKVIKFLLFNRHSTTVSENILSFTKFSMLIDLLKTYYKYELRMVNILCILLRTRQNLKSQLQYSPVKKNFGENTVFTFNIHWYLIVKQFSYLQVKKRLGQCKFVTKRISIIINPG